MDIPVHISPANGTPKVCFEEHLAFEETGGKLCDQGFGEFGWNNQHRVFFPASYCGFYVILCDVGDEL